MRGKSLARNAMLNTLKTVMSMVFPLITFPYASRILQVENMGKVNFSASVVSYFILLAGLGIKTYAIREGATVRDNKQELEVFASQIFTINVISTIVAYIALFCIVQSVNVLQSYSVLIFVQSFNIIGNTIGVEWLYTIEEDYYYITIRSILVQFVSMVLLFLLVHTPEDYVIYAGISVFASTASFIFNYFHSRKICKIKLVTTIGLNKHLSPIFIIFAMSIATTIYVNSDTTMLGFMRGDYDVGIYNAATKMYSILKNIMSASILVALPRLSNYIATSEKEKFQKESSNILNAFVVILLPTVVGTFLVADSIIDLLAGVEYAQASVPLRILCISLVFSIFAIYLTNIVLLPAKKEKTIMIATFISAFANVALNFLFIPWLGYTGAAITTTISEAIVFLWQFNTGRKLIKFYIPYRDLALVVLGCVLIAFACIVSEFMPIHIYYKLAIKVVLSIMVYFVVLALGKHSFFTGVVNSLKKGDLK